MFVVTTGRRTVFVLKNTIERPLSSFRFAISLTHDNDLQYDRKKTFDFTMIFFFFFFFFFFFSVDRSIHLLSSLAVKQVGKQTNKQTTTKKEIVSR
jgi:hypothetical protein